MCKQGGETLETKMKCGPKFLGTSELWLGWAGLALADKPSFEGKKGVFLCLGPGKYLHH